MDALEKFYIDHLITDKAVKLLCEWDGFAVSTEERRKYVEARTSEIVSKALAAFDQNEKLTNL